MKKVLVTSVFASLLLVGAHQSQAEVSDATAGLALPPLSSVRYNHQQEKKLDASAGTLDLVCIVKHEAVRESVLEVIEEGLTSHGVKYRVILGSYVDEGNLWKPTFQDGQVAGCDAVLFYVAQWKWSMTVYMHFANIWMATPDRKKQLGFASYDVRAISGKRADARTELLRLLDRLFEQYKKPTSAMPNANTPVVAPVTSVSPIIGTSEVAPIKVPSSPTKKTDDVAVGASPTAQKLRELQGLKKDGLITEEDYQLKKQELLEKY